MTKKTTAEKAVSAVKKPRTVKASAATPRVRTVRHKAAVTVDSPVTETLPAADLAVSTQPTAAPAVNPSEAIARLAYSYFEARGYSNGNDLEDWLRAEAEYYARVA